MGARRPWRSRSYDDMDDPPAAQPLQHGQQSWHRGLLERAAGHQLVSDVAEGPGPVRVDEGQQPPVDEEQLAVTIAVAEGPEPLGAERDGLVQPDAVAASHQGISRPRTC